MEQREFNKIIKSCQTTVSVVKDIPEEERSEAVLVNRLDTDKLKALPEETRHDMLLFIVRLRQPVLIELETPLLDKPWLDSMGYLYQTTGKKSGFTFCHTCEHQIV